MAVKQAELFDEIDEQATRQAVRDFFFDDGFNKRTFSHILRKAGSGDLKSPSLSADGGFGGAVEITTKMLLSITRSTHGR